MVQHDDELDIARRFEALMLPEPPMTSTVSDDVRRGRRALRQQRVIVVGASAAAIVGVTAGVVALSASGPFGPAAQQADFAGAPSVRTVATPSTPDSVAANATERALPTETISAGTTTTPDGQDGGDGFPAYATRVLLRAAAGEHLDPTGRHLIGGDNAQSQEDADGLVGAGTKLGWIVPGDEGQGLVQVGIEVADADLASAPGWRPRMETQCDVVACQAHDVAGGGTVFVNDGEDPAGTGLEIGAYYQQPDGEWVFITVYDTFGNMSPEGVESVGLTVQQVIAFVTDPSLDLVG